ncbi:DUF3592 domain-containing protein [Streptomyces daghestanicus]|jgi:hypothetical protein|uniref:DUF3592 domain-containing protein n=1 Tax=Streptomyces daghestanicus TaxID=66885 RepID=A0ABQ3Q1J0_9ACTN|nr:DUF3592 domain-containing protein [Streptomyces daghestanicus]GGU40618.1 hypothetical protein GCM10010259_34210 [Streptomyces daghestanicus]GHI31148.1 hypothetical protein Sdagh_28780 [Streptomyces daghestanicus]
MPNALMATVLCGLAGAALLWAGLHEAARARRLRRHGVRTTGVVTGGGPARAPIIAFADGEGYRVEFTPGPHGPGTALAAGRRVAVVYLPRDPGSARVLTRRHMTAPAAFVLACALTFLTCAALVAAVS